MVFRQISTRPFSVIVAPVALVVAVIVGCAADEPAEGYNDGADVNQVENGDAGDDTEEAGVDDGDVGDDTGDADNADNGDANNDDNGDANGDANNSDANNGDNADNGDANNGDNGDEAPEGMELVPEGIYTRGCNTDIDDECNDPEALGIAYDHENPAHDVELSAFYIDRHEVTEAEYDECVDAEVCDEPYHEFSVTDEDGNGADYPVVDVTSEQAITYCEWVDKRLPTEAEWEKAARGTDQRIYPWGNDDPDCTRANYEECGGEIMEVGQHPDGASPYDVEDMAGNVRNWTSDWFDSDYYDEDTDVDPQGPDSGETRTVRGGSFQFSASSLRTSGRYSMEGGADSFGHGVGFRCARSVD